MVNLQELELKLRVEKEIENEYKNLPHLMNESLILKEEHLRKVINKSLSYLHTTLAIQIWKM